MLLIILLYFLSAEHVSGTTMPIIRSSSLSAPNFQPTTTQERDDQYGNQHYSSELLMIGIVVSESYWAHKMYNKIISGI